MLEINKGIEIHISRYGTLVHMLSINFQIQRLIEIRNV